MTWTETGKTRRVRVRYALTARGIVALALDEARRGHAPTEGCGKPREAWILTPAAIELLDAEDS